MNEGFRLKGTVTVREIDRLSGEVVSEEVIENLIVNTGLEAVTDYLDGDNPATFDYMAIGTGTTAAAAGDTALETEQERSTQITPTQSGSPETNIAWVHTFSAGAGKSAITEMGMLNAGAAGTLFNRVVFTAKDNENNDLQITYDVTVS